MNRRAPLYLPAQAQLWMKGGLDMSSILREDQYFDNEADFCKVESESVRSELEKIF